MKLLCNIIEKFTQPPSTSVPCIKPSHTIAKTCSMVPSTLVCIVWLVRIIFCCQYLHWAQVEKANQEGRHYVKVCTCGQTDHTNFNPPAQTIILLYCPPPTCTYAIVFFNGLNSLQVNQVDRENNKRTTYTRLVPSNLNAACNAQAHSVP